MIKFLLLSFLLIFTSSYADSGLSQPIETDRATPSNETKKENGQTQQSSPEKKEKEPDPGKLLKVGNLAFRVSQQPTPLIAFGQNLISENQFAVQEVATEVKGKNSYYIDIQNSLIYGFKNNFSIYINAPTAVRYRQGEHHSSGPLDLLIQFEYAPYTKEHYTYYNQISLVANVTIPTGSVKKTPPTGKGANTFFIGGIYSNMAIDWFYYTSYGGVFCGSSHRTKFGNQFLYQYGVGRIIFSNSDWLLDWQLEVSGLYAGKNKIDGETDHNSGGNIIMVTPSLFLSSSKSLVIQFGMGFPIVQQLYGHQDSLKYLIQTKVSWNF